METLPEPQDPVRFFLSVLMSDEDVAAYSDPSYAIETIKKGELCWQAAASIGVQAGVAGVLGKRDDQKGLVEDLVGHALEPMEALQERLTQEARRRALTDEQARMLFHLRFGLGFLFLAKGRREAAKTFLHDMAATKLSRHGGGQSYRSGDDIVSYTDDMGWGKVLAAIMACDAYSDAEDYDEALYLTMEAGDTTGHYSLDNALDLLDRWAAKCDRMEEEQGEDTWYDWMCLLFRVADILSVCQHADTSGALPGDCDKASAQFCAYEFGQLAARFATKMAGDWPGYITQGDQERHPADYLLHALLCEHAVCSDWQKARQAFATWWELTPCYEGLPVEEIGPHTDLYWAMRIGFADKMLESTQGLEVTVPHVPALPSSISALFSEMKKHEDMLGTANVRLLKLGRDLDERLPPTEDAIEQCLRERLGDLWDNLPSDVADVLLHAEYSYEARMQSGITTRQVVMGFHDAVWACFQAYFLNRFIAFLEKEGLRSTPLWYRGFRGQWEPHEFKPNNPTSLSIRGWGRVLQVVADPEHKGTENLQVKEFVKRSWPTLGRDVLKELAGSLHEVQDYRNPAVHRQWPPRSHHEERADLEAMRKLVLGTEDGASSLIAQIYRLLGPSQQK